MIWSNFKHKLQPLIYPSVTHFHVSDNYNDPLGPLPPKIQQIYFGKVFNHSVLASFPSSLTRMIFGDYFSKVIPSLPPKLTHLVLGVRFQRTLPSPPDSMTHLTFKGSFDTEIEFKYILPNLEFFFYRNNLQIRNYAEQFPKLRSLIASKSQGESLPPNLNYLGLGNQCTLSLESLPQCLTRLVFASYSTFRQPIVNLPDSLTHLVIPDNFGAEEIRALPPRLTHLYLGLDFSSFITLPTSLTHLRIEGNYFNPKRIPLTHNITHLSVGRYFQQGDLPPNLTHFSVGEYRLALDTLPQSLTHLYFGGNLYPSNYETPLPLNIKYLSLANQTVVVPILQSENVRVEFHGAKVFWEPRSEAVVEQYDTSCIER